MSAPTIAKRPDGTDRAPAYSPPGSYDLTISSFADLEDYFEGTLPAASALYGTAHDVLIASGTYTGPIQQWSSNHVVYGAGVGTEANIWGHPSGVTLNANNANACLRISGKHIKIHGIKFDGGYTSGGSQNDAVVIGKFFADEESNTSLPGGSLNVSFWHCEMTNTGQAAIRSFGGKDSGTPTPNVDVGFYYCLIHKTGLKDGAGGNAEGIYIGQGGNYSPENGVTIKGCELHNLGTTGVTGSGELIDLKTACRNVTVEDCYLHDAHPIHQSAITVLLNDGYDYGGVDPNILIKQCVIHNVVADRLSNARGASGIDIGEDKGVTVESCMIWDTQCEAIYFDWNPDSSGNSTNNGGSATVIQNCTFWDTNQGGGVDAWRDGDGSISWGVGYSAPTITEVVTAAAKDGTHFATATSFVGPTTGTAGTNPGAGFELDYPNTTLDTDGTGAGATLDVNGQSFSNEVGAFAGSTGASTLLVGSGETYTTISAAWAAASNGDTIRVTSNIFENADTVLSGKNDILIDGQGYKLSCNWTGDQYRLHSVLGLRIQNLEFEQTNQGAAYGVAVSIYDSCAYILVEDCVIHGFDHAGVSVAPGIYISRNDGSENVWVNNCDIYDINTQNTFLTGPSAISIYQPGPVTATAPTWWTGKQTAWDMGGQAAGDMSFAFTNNRIWNVHDDAGGAGSDTDGNAIILDDLEVEQATGTNLSSYSDGTRWALIDNNVAMDTRGSCVRVFDSYGPHVVRNNTAVRCNTRVEEGTTYPLGAGAAFSFGSNQVTNHGMLVINNLALNCTSGFTDQFSYSSVTSSSTFSNNLCHGETNNVGVGVSVTASPLLLGTSTIDELKPYTESSAIGAGTTPYPPLDQDGATRSNPPTIGAYIDTGQSIGFPGGSPPGEITVVSVTDGALASTATPWTITVPTVQDDDYLVIVGTNRPDGAHSQGSQLLGSATGFTELYNTWASGTFRAEGWVLYKKMTQSESSTTVDISHSGAGSEQLNYQLYVLRGGHLTTPVDTPPTFTGGYDTSGAVTGPDPGASIGDGDLTIWTWHFWDKASPTGVTTGTFEDSPEFATYFGVGHSAWQVATGAGDPAANTVNWTVGTPAGVNYSAQATIWRAEPNTSSWTENGAALLLI